MIEYKDQFTLDGRLKPSSHMVTRAKVAAADKLLGEALKGNRIAQGQLAEVHSTSDLKFNLAHLITTFALPQFDEAERTWKQLAGVRIANDFSGVRLMSMYSEITGAGVRKGDDGGAFTGGLPTVPEATPYPYVTVSGQEAFYQKLEKKGAKFGFTWEANVNDTVGFFEQIPGELVQLALDTEEREVHEALINGTTQTLAGGTLPDGTVVPPNAKLTPDAIWQAIIELSNKTVNGKKVGRASGYNVVVPIGVKEFIDWKLGQQILRIQDGLVTLGPGDRSALNGVTVVESAWLDGDDWIIVPKPGSIRRPVLELLRLRGYESPELRVHGDTGTYVGGAAVSPFEGNFDVDTIDYRIRYVAGGVMWDSTYSLKSDGSET